MPSVNPATVHTSRAKLPGNSTTGDLTARDLQKRLVDPDDQLLRRWRLAQLFRSAEGLGAVHANLEATVASSTTASRRCQIARSARLRGGQSLRR